ncbi:A/G-specific adenine glycosylase [Pedobacter yulinensis]|uniref:Adenine DNA glycosylase n=1 Tax=Pedobacter yulinensis TaxID=2126353 RepID=A0A2T3HR06_9SPHI|nr:A/G-specific adenine glycosylase [Pedobacter yulinensis]PST84894.1 A/G-specific adenine glycosylase [Pedobacter yulinensis]
MGFQDKLISWYQVNKRDLPWRRTNDAYTIWLSEVILQQTRVEQGMPYFYRFLEAYPTVNDFAAASEQEVLRLWQGLGYYSRGRNMHFTARQVAGSPGANFPQKHEDLLKLKGVGAYTAAAVASFSANEAVPVVDGNVYRVLARVFGIHTPINSTAGKKIFAELASQLLDRHRPGLYNQAIMEFGALQCKPVSPNCGVCPLRDECYAFRNAEVKMLPVKIRKAKPRARFFFYLVCCKGDQVLVRQRGPGDIWQHLYDFPLVEQAADTGSLPAGSTLDTIKNRFGNEAKLTLLSYKKHLLTHQIIHAHFFALENYMVNFKEEAELKWVSKDELEHLPLPKIISGFKDDFLNN